MKTFRGFSLVELLAVISIFTLVASLLYPVYAEARIQAKQTHCMNNLRQIGLAYTIYRVENGGDGVYGTMEEMGIPYDPIVVIKNDHVSEQIFFCTEHNDKGSSKLYTALFSPENSVGETSWKEYVLAHREQSVLFADKNHDFPGTSSSPFLAHRALALHLDNHVSKIVRKGDPHDRSWWHPENQ